MSTDTIEAAKTVKFFNVKDPGITVLVKQDPESTKPGGNAMLAQDKYVHFVGGWCESADPEVIAVLQSERMRAKGVRCMDNPADVIEFGSATDREKAIQDMVERRARELAEEMVANQLHAEASPFLVSNAEAAESVAPADEPAEE